MAYEVIINKRFTNKLIEVLDYLEKEWGKRVAEEFLDIVQTRIDALQHHPYIGSLTNIYQVRGLHITRHNRMFYRVVKNKIIILNLYDTRKK